MPSTKDRESLIDYLEELKTVLHQKVPKFLPQEITDQYKKILPKMDDMLARTSAALNTDQHDPRLREYGLLGSQLHLKLAILKKIISSLKRKITRAQLQKLLHLSSVIVSSLFEALKDKLEDNPWLEALSELLEFVSCAMSGTATKQPAR